MIRETLKQKITSASYKLGILSFWAGVVFSSVYFNPNRIVDSEDVLASNGKTYYIFETRDGSLRTSSLKTVDIGADGVADFVRHGFVAQRMGGDFKGDVSDRVQSLYGEIYSSSKFSKK